MPAGGTQTEVMYSAGRRRTACVAPRGSSTTASCCPSRSRASRARVRHRRGGADPRGRRRTRPSSLLGVGFLGRSTRCSGTGASFASCGGSTTCGRSTSPRRSGAGATTSCRSCSATEFVGRIEPRLDRKTGSLAILGIWFEPGFEPMEAPGFVAGIRRGGRGVSVVRRRDESHLAAHQGWPHGWAAGCARRVA